jgi:hypothetical protein
MTAVAEQVTRPGVHPDLPHEVYVADPVPGGSLSSSGAKRLLPPSCPALYRWWSKNPPTPTAEMELGTAAHNEVLGVGPRIIRIDAPDWRTKAAKEQRDAIRAEGGVALLPADWDRVHDMATVLREHPVAGALLEPGNGIPEQSLFWRDEPTGVMRRCRLDWITTLADGRAVIVEYKTAPSAAPDAFARSVASFGYHLQGDFQVAGADTLDLFDGQRPALVHVVQERTPPYLIEVYQLDDEALDWGHRLARRALDIYARCVATGEWPTWGGGEVQPLSLPRWAAYAYENEETTR